MLSKPRMRKSLSRAWRRTAGAAADNKGAVLVEAAIVLPVLILVFVGMAEFSQAFTARRRVQTVASTVADLVAQNASVTTADLNDIASAAAQLMLPFSTTGLTLTVTSVGEDAQNNIVKLWSCTWGNIKTSPTCTAGGSYANLPSGLIASSTDSIIVGQTSYTYTPVIGQFLASGVAFSGAAYFKPRVSQTVTKD
jgi:Flp pilus assembly protein TadG